MPDTYDYGQLEELWIRAGGPRALAPLMAAIALAESSGNTTSNNYADNNGTQTSWGLWQISDGTHNWPGTADPNDPLANARYAVAKYRSQGLSAWGTYDSGAYKQYYKSGVAASTLPQGGGGTQQAQDTSWWNPLSWASGGKDAIDTINKGFHAIEWFFVPAHQIRVVAFAGGTVFLLPGLYALTQAGKGQGDISLALGILLLTVSGVLFFIAFHNLPTDISNLQELLAWMSEGLRSGKAPGAFIPDTGLGARTGQAAAEAV
jgi:hypothetical protein